MVNGSNSRDFLLRRKSKSLSHKLAGYETGELTGVAATSGSFPFSEDKRFLSGVGEEEKIGMGRDPKERSLSYKGGGEGMAESPLGSGMGAH